MGGGRKLNEKLATYEENLSDAFSEEKTYAVNDYVIYQNRLYKFTESKETGAFDGTKVVPCSVCEEIDKINDHVNAMKVYNFDTHGNNTISFTISGYRNHFSALVFGDANNVACFGVIADSSSYNGANISNIEIQEIDSNTSKITLTLVNWSMGTILTRFVLTFV